MKRNCNNCKHLEWGHGDVNDPEGFCCNKRQYDTMEDEIIHLRHLEIASYREKSKRCFEEK